MRIGTLVEVPRLNDRYIILCGGGELGRWTERNFYTSYFCVAEDRESRETSPFSKLRQDEEESGPIAHGRRLLMYNHDMEADHLEQPIDDTH